MARTESSPDDYLTPAAPAAWEHKVDRSRFLALLHPISGAAEAASHLADARAHHHKATHHCHAWRLGHPAETPAFGCGDDGEPSGTAGQPILRAVEGSGLSDLVVVVVRWYGGVKLGTGGLARAYGAAAAGVLAACPRRTATLCQRLRLRLPHSLMTQVRRRLAAAGGRELSLAAGEDLEVLAEAPRSRVADLERELRELFQGRGDLWRC